MEKKSTTALPTDTVAGPKLEVAHVLFTDLVGYSQLPMDQGAQLVERLTAIVEGTKAFRRAKNSNQLILLPTGDGMALAFFGDPVAPVKCAIEISRVLRSEPELKLRMGIHSGPVFRTIDINEASNVAGGGINLAQRVMDCGDAGHILLSQSIADVLRQLSNWREHLHDVGIQEAKHGERLHIFNLHGSDFGNPEAPKKSRLQEAPPFPGAGKRRVAVLSAAAVIAIAVIAFSPHFQFDFGIPTLQRPSASLFIGVQALSGRTEANTQWVKKKTSRFSSPSTDFSKSISKDRASPRMVA